MFDLFFYSQLNYNFITEVGPLTFKDAEIATM